MKLFEYLYLEHDVYGNREIPSIPKNLLILFVILFMMKNEKFNSEFIAILKEEYCFYDRWFILIYS